MADDISILRARSAGQSRYTLVIDYSGDWKQILSKFGFTASFESLTEYPREKALSILTSLLRTDMAYGQPLMSESEARALSEQVVARYSNETSRYYSNGDWENPQSWMPLTAATFDGGLIIEGPDHSYFCIWFEDED